MKKFVLAIYSGVLMFAYTIASADGTTTDQLCVSENIGFDSIGHLINWASCTLIRVVVPFLFSLALVAFIWGVIQFYLNPDNEEKRKKGKSFIIGGIIAFFVMLSIWGIVRILTGTFGLQNTMPALPQ